MSGDSFIRVGAWIRLLVPVRTSSGEVLPERTICVVTSVTEEAPARPCPDHPNYPFCSCVSESGVVPALRTHARVERRSAKGSTLTCTIFPEDAGALWEELRRGAPSAPLRADRLRAPADQRQIFVIDGRGPDLAVAEVHLSDGTMIRVLREAALRWRRRGNPPQSPSEVRRAVRQTLAILADRLSGQDADSAVKAHFVRRLANDPSSLREALDVTFTVIELGWLRLAAAGSLVPGPD